jgi:SAM-dependent methyltransferase
VSAEQWEQVGASESPSWYLDPLVAQQKKQENLALLRRWTKGLKPRSILKTDLFEEANGEDQVLFELDNGAQVLGMDVSRSTVGRAQQRGETERSRFLVADVRRLGLASESIDVVFSNSTLDHFETSEEFHRSLKELVRVLAPGGALIVTLDNSHNPLYWLLRFASALGWSPFPMGHTTSLGGLVRTLEAEGLSVTDTDHLIHNPRGVSTALFLLIRKILGNRGDGLVRSLLSIFGLMGRLPTRGITSSFVAVRAVKAISE